MDYAALKAEIALPAYDGMEDQAVADALNAETVDVVRDIPTSEVRGFLLATGEWGAIALLSRSTPSEAIPATLIAAAITVIDTLRLTTTLEVTKPQFWASLQGAVAAFHAAGVLSEQTAGVLLAMRDAKTSRAAQLGLGIVAACDVQTARLV